MKKTIQLFRRDRGQSLVEFALVLPLFILITLGAIEFSRLWMSMNIMTSAAREGARVAAVTAPDASRVQSTASGILNAAGLTNASVSLSGPSSSTEVTVTVQADFTSTVAGFIPGVPSTLHLQQHCTMRWEG